MLFPAHLFLGLLMGLVIGNIPAALVGALFVDADHLLVYAKHGMLWRPKTLWATIMKPNDDLGDQRNLFHHLAFATVACVGMFLALPHHIALGFSAGYASHLFLDLLDGSDIRPLRPITWNIRGPIPYASKREAALTAILFLVCALVYICS